MKKLSIIILSVLIAACSNRQIAGTYFRIHESLTLNKDSSYNYMYQLHHPSFYSKGSWRMIGHDTIHIKSDVDWDNIPIQVDEAYETGGDAKIITEAATPVNSSSLKRDLEWHYVINGKRSGTTFLKPESCPSKISHP